MTDGLGTTAIARVLGLCPADVWRWARALMREGVAPCCATRVGRRARPPPPAEQSRTVAAAKTPSRKLTGGKEAARDASGGWLEQRSCPWMFSNPACQAASWFWFGVVAGVQGSLRSRHRAVGLSGAAAAWRSRTGWREVVCGVASSAPPCLGSHSPDAVIPAGTPDGAGRRLRLPAAPLCPSGTQCRRARSDAG
jgi:hypothetical protein